MEMRGGHILRTLLGILSIATPAARGAPGDSATPAESTPLAELVQTVTGADVPQRHNSQTNLLSDMVKICDVKIGGRFLFVATYYSTTLCVFERDPETAKLTFRDSFENPYKSRWRWASLLTRESSDGTIALYYLYHGALHAFAVDGETGSCMPMATLMKIGDPPAVLSPDSRRLITSGAVLRLDEAGAPSVESRREAGGVARVFSPDGRHFYEAGHARISCFAWRVEAGLGETLFSVDLEGPSPEVKPARTWMSFSPDGRFLYVGQVSEGYGSRKQWFSWRFERDRETGRLTLRWSGVPPRDLTQAEMSLFTRDGRVGYFIQADPADTEGYRSCPAWFTRDVETGEMIFRGKGPAARVCCMDLDAVHGSFYAGSCGQDARHTHLFVFKTRTATPAP